MKYKYALSLALVTLVFSLIPAFSYAAGTCLSVGGSSGPFAANLQLSDGCGGQAIGSALCEVVSWFNGPVGSAIASLAVIFLGISAFFGKVNWGTAILFAAGIVAIFGADTIVRAILPTSAGFTSCG